MNDSNKHKILIVDDDELNLEIMEEILSDDYDLIKACNGVEAIEQFKTNNPVLILLDIMMPEMNGYETCDMIKEICVETCSFTPHIIMVSAKASLEERVRGYESGTDDYIIKPFDEEELLAKVRVHIRQHEESLNNFKWAKSSL